MDDSQLHELLEKLIRRWEDEVVEFKNVSDSYSTSDIGKYFSALANEANLRHQASAWLVFGVDNNSRSVVGSHYRSETTRLQSLKHQIAQDAEPSISFREIHEFKHSQGRVILFEIPAAPLGIPIAWKGFHYARAGESLIPLPLDKQDEIRQQTIFDDWTAQIVESAEIHHLDEMALLKSKESFAKKYANRFQLEEVMGWPTETFLDRAKLTKDGRITRTALLLLGKPESAHLLNPHPAQMTWKLEGEEKAYEHFGPPFLLNTTSLYQRIRNIQIRILPEDELYPIEVSKYDQKIVMEALHNCIAHQDYNRCGRIVVTEQPDRLIFENEGAFFEGKPDDYVTGHKTPLKYRNPFLAQAMAELNMIDTMGYGIHEMFAGQAKRYFPMPDYHLDNPLSVKMAIHGRIVDLSYTRLLIQQTDLPLSTVFALDRIQKKLPVNDAITSQLKRQKLIEGRKPNLHVSASVAKTTATKVDYIRTRAQDDDYYTKLITDFIRKFGKASRKEIDKLLSGKFSDVLNDEQQKNKIANLLTKMRRNGQIKNVGSRTVPEWHLAERMQKEKGRMQKECRKKPKKNDAFNQEKGEKS